MTVQEENDIEKLRYPLGRHLYNGSLTATELLGRLDSIAALPRRLKEEVIHLTEAQLDTPYRPGGWTVRQVVHHLCDSHMNAYVRFKLALTEQNPTIKPYAEALWAETADNKMPVEPGLALLSGLHQKWMVLLRSIPAADLQKTYFHPQPGKTFTLDEAISLYAWHSNHHLAHITGLKKRSNWA